MEVREHGTFFWLITIECNGSFANILPERGNGKKLTCFFTNRRKKASKEENMTSHYLWHAFWLASFWISVLPLENSSLINLSGEQNVLQRIKTGKDSLSQFSLQLGRKQEGLLFIKWMHRLKALSPEWITDSTRASGGDNGSGWCTDTQQRPPRYSQQTGSVAGSGWEYLASIYFCPFGQPGLPSFHGIQWAIWLVLIYFCWKYLHIIFAACHQEPQ